MITITNHARLRCKQRLGWDKSTIDETVERIYRNKTNLSDYHNDVIDYVLIKLNQGGMDFRIHGGLLFMFSGQRLVTVFMFPNRIKKHLNLLKHLAASPKVDNSNSQPEQ